jgi:glycosyltransferase involved in cell wall biosynthesis
LASASDVSVVIPAFNEEAAVGRVVAGLTALAVWREILVVDDSSSDQTAAAAERAGARVIRHPYNKGNGAAVKTGVREAKGDVVLLMDADGQHDPQDALGVVAPIGAYDLSIGTRAAADQPRLRALGNRVFNALATWLSGHPVHDLTSGFRAARRAPLLELLHLLPNRFSYPTTSCLAFLKAGYNVTFVPVTARARAGESKIRPAQDGVRFLLIIFKIVTLYNPLKIFFPIAAAAFTFGTLYGVWNVVERGKIPMGAALLIQLAVVVFLFGLISEQIAAGQDRK